MMNKIRQGSVKVSLKDRIFGFGYGMGASVVIIGVLFKLMYWQGADIMLTVGLVTEALIFAMSAFEKPLKTYEWDKLFDFDSGQVDLQFNNGFAFPPTTGYDVPASEDTAAPQAQASAQAQTADTPPVFQAPIATGGAEPVDASPVSAVPVSAAGTGYVGPIAPIAGISDSDAERLSQSIQDLANTADKLNEIASVSLETEKFAASINEISENTSRYAESQEGLIKAAADLHQAYERMSIDTEKIEVNTQEYRTKVERINNNLAGMNSIYEILLKDIHAQSVSFHNQTEISKRMSDEMQSVTREMSKLVNISDGFTVATEKIKTNASELADNVAKLNAIYGNMLNSMS